MAGFIREREFQRYESCRWIDGHDLSSRRQRLTEIGCASVAVFELDQGAVFTQSFEYDLRQPVALQRAVDDDAGVVFDIHGVVFKGRVP